MSFESVINCCRDLLLNFPDAKDIADYADKRLSHNGQETFTFGYFPTNNNLQTLINTIGETKLKELELLDRKIINDRNVFYSRMQEHNLVMPYRDVYGNVIGIVGRTIFDDEKRKDLDIPKYKNTSRATGLAKGSHLFGLYNAKKYIIENNCVYVVEGQFDCITAYDKGLKNVVALGTSSMTFEQFALLTRYTNNIMLLLDNDDVGKSGTEKIIKNYSMYANIRIIELPRGVKDIDEFLSDNSVEDLKLIMM